MFHVRKKRHMLALVCEKSQKPDFRNQTNPKSWNPCLLAVWPPPCCLPSLTLKFLYWQNVNVNIRVLVVKMKWDNVYKALRQTCLSYSIDKLLLDVVITKLTGALLMKSILNSKRGSFKLWSSLRSYNICEVGISFCVEIRCCFVELQWWGW